MEIVVLHLAAVVLRLVAAILQDVVRQIDMWIERAREVQVNRFVLRKMDSAKRSTNLAGL